MVSYFAEIVNYVMATLYLTQGTLKYRPADVLAGF